MKEFMLQNILKKIEEMEGKMETYCSELAGNVIPAHKKNVQTLPHSALKKTTGKHPSKTTQFQVGTSHQKWNRIALQSIASVVVIITRRRNFAEHLWASFCRKCFKRDLFPYISFGGVWEFKCRSPKLLCVKFSWYWPRDLGKEREKKSIVFFYIFISLERVSTKKSGCENLAESQTETRRHLMYM